MNLNVIFYRKVLQHDAVGIVYLTSGTTPILLYYSYSKMFQSSSELIGVVLMPNNDGSKDKILYLLKILEECTDEDHGLTMPEIQKKMIYMMHLEEGQEPNRKTIKAHIDSLSDFFDYDIGMEREGAKTYYKMLSREFDLQDLQFIADAVATSKFLTEKKTKELIDKLGTLCSSYQRSSLSRKVTTANRIKSMNDKIHYNLNSLNLAISEDKKVTFRYFSYDEKKERKFSKSSYKVSP